MPTIPEKYGLVAVREVCVGRQCVNYALTKGGLWVPAPWAWRIVGRPKGVFLTGQRTRVGGVEVIIEEAIAVVSLEEARRLCWLWSRVGGPVPWQRRSLRQQALMIRRKSDLTATGNPAGARA